MTSTLDCRLMIGHAQSPVAKVALSCRGRIQPPYIGNGIWVLLREAWSIFNQG
jgi:hypothetical protein